MKLMLSQLQGVDFTLGALLVGENGKALKLPVTTSFRFGKFIKKLNEEIQAFEAARAELLKQYCKRDEQGQPIIVENQYQFDDEIRPTVEAEFNKLAQEKVKLPWEPLNLEALGNINIDPRCLMTLVELGFIKDVDIPITEEENTEEVAE